MTLTSTQKGILYAIFGAVSWGLNGTVTQFLFMNYTVDSVWLTATRMILAGLLITLLAWPERQQQFRRLFASPHEILQLIIVGIAGLLLAQYSYLTAIKYSNAGTATVLQNLCIVIMAIYLSFRHRALPPFRESIAIFLAIAGVFLAATNGSISSMILSVEALFWGIASALGAVTYPLLSHDLSQRWHTSVINGPSMIFGGVTLGCVFQFWNIAPDLDWLGIAAVAFIIIIGTAISFSCVIRSVQLIGPMKTTLICTLEPVLAAVTSALCLGTVFHSMEIVGFICILLTVFIIVRPEKAS